MIALHLLLAAATALLAGVGRPALAAWLGRDGPPSPRWVDLRRLLRKEAVSPGLPVAALLPGAILACDAAALLLVPFAPALLPSPFADLLAVLGLLGAGRLLAGLLAMEAGGTAGGTDAARTALVLAASGPAVALLVALVAGDTGTTSLLAAPATGRDGAGPLLLAATAAAVLGWADWHAAPGGAAFLSGRALAVARVSSGLRSAAWLGLVAALLPAAAFTVVGVVPGVFPGVVPGLVLGWAARTGMLLVAWVVADAWAAGRDRRLPPVAAPAVAALAGLLGAMLLALRGGAA